MPKLSLTLLPNPLATCYTSNMNFLGHFYLNPAGDKELLVGNFLGDFVKGHLELQNFPAQVLQGIAIHRTIDQYTDTHPLILSAKQLFAKKYRRYAGIVLDMAMDHFLAKYWNEYHPQSLALFSTAIYRVLNQHISIMPETARHAVRSMSRYNWLCSYTEQESLEFAFESIGKRLSRENPMHSAIQEFNRLYDTLEETFRLFICEIQAEMNARH